MAKRREDAGYPRVSLPGKEGVLRLRRGRRPSPCWKPAAAYRDQIREAIGGKLAYRVTECYQVNAQVGNMASASIRTELADFLHSAYLTVRPLGEELILAKEDPSGMKLHEYIAFMIKQISCYEHRMSDTSFDYGINVCNRTGRMTFTLRMVKPHNIDDTAEVTGVTLDGALEDYDPSLSNREDILLAMREAKTDYRWILRVIVSAYTYLNWIYSIGGMADQDSMMESDYEYVTDELNEQLKEYLREFSGDNVDKLGDEDDLCKLFEEGRIDDGLYRFINDAAEYNISALPDDYDEWVAKSRDALRYEYMMNIRLRRCMRYGDGFGRIRRVGLVLLKDLKRIWSIRTHGVPMIRLLEVLIDEIRVVTENPQTVYAFVERSDDNIGSFCCEMTRSHFIGLSLPDYQLMRMRALDRTVSDTGSVFDLLQPEAVEVSRLGDNPYTAKRINTDSLPCWRFIELYQKQALHYINRIGSIYNNESSTANEDQREEENNEEAGSGQERLSW